VRLDGKPWLKRIDCGIGRDISRIDGQLLPPRQARRDALLDDDLEEAAEHDQPVSLAKARQARVIGQRLGQGVAHVPAQAQPVRCHAHKLTFRAQSLKEKDQLELEEDDRVDRRSPDPSVGVTDQIPNEGKIERAVEVTREVPGRHKIVQRDQNRFIELAGFWRSKHARLRTGNGEDEFDRVFAHAQHVRLFQQAGPFSTRTAGESVSESHP